MSSTTIFRISSATGKPWPASWASARLVIEYAGHQAAFLGEDLIVYCQARPGARVKTSRRYYAHARQVGPDRWKTSEKIRAVGAGKKA